MSNTWASLWRGCAANFSQPVTEEDLREAQFLVETVYYFNCYIPRTTPSDIVYRSGDGEHDILRHVFRWDLTPYEEVFENGFRCRRQANTSDAYYFNVQRYVNSGGRPIDSRCVTTHAFVSTTLSTRWRPPTRSVTISTEVYRYEIYAPGGIYVAATLGQYYPYPAQDEVCFVAGIAPQYIRSAQRFRLTISAGTGRRRWRRVNNELVINERFNPQAHPFQKLNVRTPLDSILEDGSITNLSLTYYPTSNRRKRSAADAGGWYAVDVAEVESYINAAFRSSCANEAYLFMKNEYVRIDYDPCSKGDKVLSGPHYISDGFPILRGTAFGEYGIDCAFGSSSGTSQAYIFSGNLCVLIEYNPAGTTYDKIIKGPKTIAAMFPFLKRTVFENGIDAAFESTTEYEVYLFKGNQNARINYEGSGSISVRPINEGFPCLKNTMFEDGVDASFASHKYNEAYLFKGDSYALINFAPGTSYDKILGGRVKKIKQNWPSLDKILPRKNHGLDGYHTDSNCDEDEHDLAQTKNKQAQIRVAKMHRERTQELDDVPNDNDDFESPSHEKGMWTKGLPQDMNDNEDNGVCLASKGNMVGETLRQQRSKKKGKRACTIEDSGEEEEEDDCQGGQDDLHEMGVTIHHPDHAQEVFTPFFSKGVNGAILMGDSGLANASVSRGLLNAIILPKDKAKYQLATMVDLTNRREELLYELNLICKMEDSRERHCNNKLDLCNKAVKKKDYELKKAGEEKEKMAGELKALLEKVQELQHAKKVEAKTVEVTINKLRAEVEALQHDLDASEARSKKNFEKGEGWKTNATKRGHYIADLHHKLDSTFSCDQKRVLQSLQKEFSINISLVQEHSRTDKAKGNLYIGECSSTSCQRSRLQCYCSNYNL